MLKHDNLWGANPDTAEEMDEIERRRKKAMRTALLLLALVVALNVVINELSCVGPSAAKRNAGVPVAQQPEPSGQGAGGGEPALSLDIDADQAGGDAGRPGRGARRARGVLQGGGRRGGPRVRVGRPRLPVGGRLVLPGGGAAGLRRREGGRRGRGLLPGLRHVHGRPLGVPDRRLRAAERIERGGDAL